MSKAMDILFYWLRDRVRQKQIYVFWKNGYLNLADYVTKHHPTQHHRAMRPTYLANTTIQDRRQACNSPPTTNPEQQLSFQRKLLIDTALQGCVDILRKPSIKLKHNIPIQSSSSNNCPLLQQNVNYRTLMQHNLNNSRIGATEYKRNYKNNEQMTDIKFCAPKYQMITTHN